MSEHEFESYLTLLSRTLRLSRSQREAIASELRDHMQERLDELVKLGMSQTQAAQIALEEFGDAAGLAAEFVSISRDQRRKRVMKCTAVSMSCVIVVAMLLATFWPSSPHVPGVAQVVAQDEGGASPNTPADDQGQTKEATNEENNTLTKNKLAKRIEAKFEETPLEDVIQYLGELHDIEFYVNKTSLDELGVAVDSPVTLALKRVRGDMLLNLLLDQLDLVYIVRDGIVIVTTEEDIETVMEVRVYNCRDLLEMSSAKSPRRPRGQVRPHGPGGFQDFGSPNEKRGDEGGGDFGDEVPGQPAPGPGAGAARENPNRAHSHVLFQLGGGGLEGGFGGDDMQGSQRMALTPAEDLIQLVQTSVLPDTWETQGGPGTVEEFRGLIVVNHNPRAHQLIEQLLGMLREAAEKPPGTTVRAP